MLLGKLSPSGVLSDISRRSPQTWDDGSQDVPLATMPVGLGPFGYDQAKGDWTQLLSGVQAAAIAAFQAQADAMIGHYYSDKTLSDLNVLYTEALVFNYPNRLAYLKPVRNWGIAIATAVKTAIQQVMAATDIPTVQAVKLAMPAAPALVDQVTAAKMSN